MGQCCHCNQVSGKGREAEPPVRAARTAASASLTVTLLGQYVCPLELQTNLCDDYVKFYNHGEGPY